jgi:DNA gyrase subunit A
MRNSESLGVTNEAGVRETSLRTEVEKRYLAYALSTIVARALPDVRDGLKPVHRRILFAMSRMRLDDAAKMRKSAAVVGEVIGKYHPHGDQAAYDSLVRMAQDFSLRYTLVDGSGNFGSIDGDSPAAMRYTETRLSAFANLLLREIDQGTTTFRPTYDGMGDEPDVLPALVPNLLLNGSSGIAVGMSCSFPPHNLREVLQACREAIKNPDIDTAGLLKFIKGPDFPTGAQIILDDDNFHDIYKTGHGAIRVRASYITESVSRGKTNLVITSMPYSVNKSRLIERIANLIRDKRLRSVYDVRDESAQDIRVVLELRGADVKPDSVMAYLYKHTDLQINFPLNFIAINPAGSPDRLSLGKIIRYFLDFRYEKTVQRLQFRLAALNKRIHALEGFEKLFDDLDMALQIIRSARSKQEAASGLKSYFGLDDEQVDAILELRLYRLVGMEIGKVLDELHAKRKEARDISTYLSSPQKLWNMIDSEFSEMIEKFGDRRRTLVIREEKALSLEYNPEEFTDQDDVTVILTRDGWIRRIKSEVVDISALKFRDGDSLFSIVRVNTSKTLALFSNFGKVYVIKAAEAPATGGFGDPVSSLVNLSDGELLVGLIAPDPVKHEPPQDAAPDALSDEMADTAQDDQPTLFGNADSQRIVEDIGERPQLYGLLVTKMGRGFRFDLESTRETTKRAGRKIINLQESDQVLSVRTLADAIVAVASDNGRISLFRADQVPVMSGVSQGVILIKLDKNRFTTAMETMQEGESVSVESSDGRQISLVADKSLIGNRGTKGKKVLDSIIHIHQGRKVGQD